MTAVSKWTARNGFKISSTKAKAVHFRTHQLLAPSPVISVGRSNIEYKSIFMFFGIVFDCKLTFEEHVKELKVKCQKKMGLLRMITTSEWGADQQMVMYLYRALIRSKLDYRVIIYGSANSTLLKELESIYGLLL